MVKLTKAKEIQRTYPRCAESMFYPWPGNSAVKKSPALSPSNPEGPGPRNSVPSVQIVPKLSPV